MSIFIILKQCSLKLLLIGLLSKVKRPSALSCSLTFKAVTDTTLSDTESTADQREPAEWIIYSPGK